MPRRQALVFGAAGSPAAVCCGLLSAAGIGLCGFVCRSFCRRRAASPPSSVSVSGGLPLRCVRAVSVAGGLPLRPRAFGPRPPTATRRAPPSTSEGAYGSETVPPPPDPASSGLATASRVQNSPSCPRPRPATASRVQNTLFCTRLRPAIASRVQNSPFCPRPRPATASRVQNSPSCPRLRPAGEPGTDGRWSEGRK